MPESAEAQVADRETRGLRSSARVRDQALGLTPKKEAPPAYAGQGVEERGYYEDGRYVRAEKGAPCRGLLSSLPADERL